MEVETIYAILGFILGAGLMFIVLGGATMVGWATATCPDHECVYRTTTATYEIVGNRVFEGTSLVGINPKFEAKIKNTADQAAEFTVSVACETLNKAETLTQARYIQPGEIDKVPFEFGVGFNENWKCTIIGVSGESINTCQLVEK